MNCQFCGLELTENTGYDCIRSGGKIVNAWCFDCLKTHREDIHTIHEEWVEKQTVLIQNPAERERAKEWLRKIREDPRGRTAYNKKSG